MRPAATRPSASSDSSTLYLAFELGNAEWKLAMTTRIDQSPLVRTIAARGLTTLDAEVARAKAHFGLPATAPVCSCYEAGRDGFWLHRYLGSIGITNCIVDSSSIEVNRRFRRTKTDRLDAAKLVTMLAPNAGTMRCIPSRTGGSGPALPVGSTSHHLVHRQLEGVRSRCRFNSPLGGFTKFGCSTAVDTERR